MPCTGPTSPGTNGRGNKHNRCHSWDPTTRQAQHPSARRAASSMGRMGQAYASRMPLMSYALCEKTGQVAFWRGTTCRRLTPGQGNRAQWKLLPLGGIAGFALRLNNHAGRHDAQKQKMPANKNTDDRIRTYQINSSFFRTWARASCASARWVSCNEGGRCAEVIALGGSRRNGVART